MSSVTFKQKTHKLGLSFGALILGTAFMILPTNALAVPLGPVSVSSSATGDLLFSYVSGIHSDVVNGDFTIDERYPAGGSKTGDGKNETTFWNSNFNSHANVGDFNTVLGIGGKLTSARPPAGGAGSLSRF